MGYILSIDVVQPHDVSIWSFMAPLPFFRNQGAKAHKIAMAAAKRLHT